MSEVEQRVILPPGLYLPTADEDPAQFLAKNYTNETEDWRIVEFGQFAVALAAFEVAAGNRVSAMPTKEDFTNLRKEGYGPNEHHISSAGGTLAVQQELGFYPRGYRPDRDALLERYEWIATEVIDPNQEFGESFSMRDIFIWCSSRNLGPNIATNYEVLDGDISPIRKHFERLENLYARDSSKQNVYQLGALALEEKGKLPTTDDLGKQTRKLVEHHFTGTTRFWLEFDKVSETRGLTEQDFVSLATRLAIRTGDRGLTFPNTNEYITNQELPSKDTIIRRVGGLKPLRLKVAEELEVYDDLVAELGEIGVDPEVTRLICGRFEATPEFRQWAISGKDFLVRLSGDIVGGPFLKKLLGEGLNLLDPWLYDLQLEELGKQLNKYFGEDEGARRFVLEAIPRLDPDEAIARIEELKSRSGAEWVLAKE